ncbi:MAG: riboflavin synthase subunit alpha [Chloroflexi bacterium RBG_16_56_11]|nr:MAG: riboflavin synthase subunit alpha [Chloroflexi bacterium RBG_16_56_11]
MFTGIVQEVGNVVSAPAEKLTVAAKEVIQGIPPGGSVAVNGVCLTVITFNSRSFTVEVMPETLKKTNLGLLKTGDRVNLERPLGLGGELGGHLVQGHIDGTGKVISITKEGDAMLMKFQASPEIMRYIVTKGFIAVDGTSLTVVEKENDSFTVSIVGYTREHTILADRMTGDVVNLEADIIGKYVAEYTKPQGAGMTAAFLQEHGFPVVYQE